MKSLLRTLAVVTAGCTALPALAGELVIQFANNTWVNVTLVEYALPGSGAWTAAALPEGLLKSGEFFELKLPEGDTQCTFDLRLTKDDGSVHDRPAVDFCAATYYHFADQ
jgi:hypothetical protein